MNKFINFIFFCLITINIATAQVFKNEFFNFQISPDESQIYVIVSSGPNDTRELHVIDISSGNLVKKIALPLVTHFSWFNPNMVVTLDGKKLYVIDIDKKLYSIDIASGIVEQIKNKPKQDIDQETSSAISLSQDGKKLYIADGVEQKHSPALIHVLDTTSNHFVKKIQFNGSWQDGTWSGWWRGESTLDEIKSQLYISRQINHYDSEVYRLNTKTLTLDNTIFAADYGIESLAVNSDSGLLYATSKEKIYVIDPVSGKTLDVIKPEFAFLLKSIIFTANGSKLYSLNFAGSSNDGIIVLDTMTKTSHLIRATLYDQSAMIASADGSRIYVCNGEDIIHVIDTHSDLIIRDLNIL